MLKFGSLKPALKVVTLAAVVIGAGCATAKPEKAEMAAPAEPAMKVVMKEMALDTSTLFAFDSDKLTSEGMAAIDRLVSDAGGKAAGQITVTGHADRIGNDDYNMKLSERRANSVASYMAAKGVPSDSISASGRGESEPVVECADSNWKALVDCLAPNRRVVVIYPVMVEEEVMIEN
jgi:OOP family OmpA-OmpF porin